MVPIDLKYTRIGPETKGNYFEQTPANVNAIEDVNA